MKTFLILKIAEAQTKDVGRGIARIDPDNFKKLKAEVGDVIEIKSAKPPASTRRRGEAGKIQKRTVAKLMPTYPDDRGRGIIQVDGIVRENAGVGLGEKTEIEKVSYREAGQVILLPLTIGASLREEEDKEYLSKILTGTPLIKNDKLRATLFGSKFQEFQVIETDPPGVVLITPQTLIKIKSSVKERKKVGITYEDIGGLKKEIHRIREMIELPLKYPEVFDRLGIDPPKGVLLYGPPGCGKTLIAKAVVNETDANFYHISGPEIMGKFYGESEGHLREIFEEAEKNAPAILFIDEIDAIAPKREDMGGEKQVERRVVAQLLALMDGLESRGQLVVIGATNIPNTLDPALRRPGRFDREISISIPDKNGRREILEIHTRGMPLAKDTRPVRNGISDGVNIEKLAEITHGFVGADLEALVREAAMAALREIMPEIEFEKEYIPYNKLAELKVTMDHFREALKEVGPSTLREVFIEVPDVTWEEVGGLEKIKQTLKETIEWPLKYAKLFEYAHSRPPKGILLYGPPGCGKTLIAKAVAHESNINFISIKGPQLLSQWVGESERGVREVFKKAKMASPCIVFFDELDALVPKRGNSSDSHVTERVVSQFLAEMDGIEELKGVIILGATNRKELIDEALLRPGRFDFLLEIPKPDEKGRLEIFKVHTRGKPLASDVNLGKMAKNTEGLVGSDIESICERAALTAIREFLSDRKSDSDTRSEAPKNKDLEKFLIKAKHFTGGLHHKDE